MDHIHRGSDGEKFGGEKGKHGRMDRRGKARTVVSGDRRDARDGEAATGREGQRSEVSHERLALEGIKGRGTAWRRRKGVGGRRRRGGGRRDSATEADGKRRERWDEENGTGRLASS